MARRKGSKRVEPRFDVPEVQPAVELRAEPREQPARKRTARDAEPARPRRAQPRKRAAKDTGKGGRKGGGKQAGGKQAGGGSRGRTSARKTRNPARWRLLRRAVYWSSVIGIWGAIAVVCVVGYYALQLPQMSTWSVPARPPNARIVSVDGDLVANRGVSSAITGGEAMRLDEMSPYLPKAVIAIEDRRFHYHFGIDPIGLARAMASNLFAGRLVQGGSTLTQQLAKNLFLEPERTIERKIQEAVLAIWLETKFSKDEILELYLNRVYFGSGAYGADAAARHYFDKSARDLTLGEAALIAGLLKAPSRLSPARDAKAAEERAQVVLSAMLEEGYVTEREVAAALSMKPEKAKRYWSGSQHYVADMVMAQLPELIGKYRGDVVVQTSIDLDLQTSAEHAIGAALKEAGSKRSVGQGALVALDGTGAIRALVGGREYADSQFNRATDAKRQPGSAFKPIVYLTALEAGRTPESVRRDAPVKIGSWTPENYDREYRGPVTLSEALAESLNTVAAQLVMEVGPKSVSQTAHRLGITSKIANNASIALGTSEVSLMELTGAYAPFANGGYRVTPFLIDRVTSIDGKLLYQRNPAPAPQVVGPRELGMMNAMLSRVVTSGTGKAAQVSGWQVAGKTGTTQNSRDALFVGYTANLIAGIWFGNDDGKPMKRVTGGSLPAQTWSNFMRSAHKGVPVALLPGGFVPESVALPVPVPRPVRRVAATGGASAPGLEDGVRVTNRQVTGGVRPAQDIGGGAPVRRSLFDRLFGERPG